MSRKKGPFDENKHSEGHGSERPSYGGMFADDLNKDAAQDGFESLFGEMIQKKLTAGYTAYIERRNKFFKEHAGLLKKNKYSTYHDFLLIKDELTKDEFERLSKEYYSLKEKAVELKEAEEIFGWKSYNKTRQIIVMLYLDDSILHEICDVLKIREARS
ncbi:MAG: hypothetical protein WC547_01805 [Candidatus Omnitrophota bacterium]